MQTKKCLRCGGSSYPATTSGPWPCPYCFEDLATVPGRPAMAGPASLQDEEVQQELALVKMAASRAARELRPVLGGGM